MLWLPICHQDPIPRSRFTMVLGQLRREDREKGNLPCQSRIHAWVSIFENYFLTVIFRQFSFLYQTLLPSLISISLACCFVPWNTIHRGRHDHIFPYQEELSYRVHLIWKEVISCSQLYLDLPTHVACQPLISVKSPLRNNIIPAWKDIKNSQEEPNDPSGPWAHLLCMTFVPEFIEQLQNFLDVVRD